jgi:hypothetical protein
MNSPSFSDIVDLCLQDAKIRGVEAYLQRGRAFEKLDMAELNAARAMLPARRAAGSIYP